MEWQSCAEIKLNKWYYISLMPGRLQSSFNFSLIV
jgi:hypothetical protein